MAYTAYEIGNTGEQVVVMWLKANGYSVTRWDTKSPGKTDIEAKSTTIGLLVQVKASQMPELPAELSADEKRALIARAKTIGFQAWSARVTLDGFLRPVGEIVWLKLYEPRTVSVSQ